MKTFAFKDANGEVLAVKAMHAYQAWKILSDTLDMPISEMRSMGIVRIPTPKTEVEIINQEVA